MRGGGQEDGRLRALEKEGGEGDALSMALVFESLKGSSV